MARMSIGFAMVVVASLGQIAPASARDPVPVQAQLSQATTPSVLPSALGTQVDSRVEQALAASRGGDASTLAGAVGRAFDGVLKANAPAIAADAALAVAMAKEATRVVVATPGLDAAARVQIAAAIAASAAKAAPTAAASILVAVLEALPPDEQSRQDAIIIANAIDAAVPGAGVTAALGGLGTPNAPLPISGLVPLLTVLANQSNVSPH